MKRRCLIVDDAEDVRLLLRLGLIRAGFDVVAEAATEAAAFARAATATPDVVLLDLTIPGSDGLTTIAGLRALLPDAHIAVCSGLPAQMMAPACLGAGADQYLEKTSLLDVGHELAKFALPESP